MEKQLKNQLKELHTIRAEFLAKHLEESEELPQEFIKLMGKARSGGLLNENYQPLISQTESALLAQLISFEVWGERRWKPFRIFWGALDLKKAFNKAQFLNKQTDVEDKFLKILGKS